MLKECRVQNLSLKIEELDDRAKKIHKLFIAKFNCKNFEFLLKVELILALETLDSLPPTYNLKDLSFTFRTQRVKTCLFFGV